MFDLMMATAKALGKPEWRPMLIYTANLHARSTHPAAPPFPHPWEEIGPGYCYGPAFGHWDIVHQAMDAVRFAPDHARAQVLNLLALQAEDGLIPGALFLREGKAEWDIDCGHPHVWPELVDDWTATAGSDELVRLSFDPLVRLIGWYETYRKAEPDGFFYRDILDRRWESGVDEGIRFDDAPEGRLACIDATCHVYWLYDHASRWAQSLGRDPRPFAGHADRLRSLIQETLFNSGTGLFHDSWWAHLANAPLAFEGMWPIVVGAASDDQANRLISDNLLNPDRFFTTHPVATVAACDPRFEPRMWRGPVWNSMTYWAARGCVRYGRPDAAKMLLGRALDASAAQFERTCAIWEFYDAHGGPPEQLARKPHTDNNAPCRDYLGHNPLIAMAELWEVCLARTRRQSTTE